MHLRWPKHWTAEGDGLAASGYPQQISGASHRWEVRLGFGQSKPPVGLSTICRYAAVVSDLRREATNVTRLRAFAGPLPGIYPSGSSNA